MTEETRGKRILVMDDDTAVAMVLGEVLEKIGYVPTLSKGGDEAVLLYRKAMEAGEPFAAVMMDLTVPGGVGGEEAAQRLLSMDPEAKLIVCSAFATHPVMTMYREHGFAAAVAKPFKIAGLKKALEMVFEGRT